MRYFNFGGKRYTVVAKGTESHIRLPDGTLLAVGKWVAVSPPVPSDLTIATAELVPESVVNAQEVYFATGGDTSL